MRKFTATKSGKLSKILFEYYSGELSFSRFKALLKNKEIKVDGKRVSKDISLIGGEKIEVYYDGDKSLLLEVKEIYVDENILVAYKSKNRTSEETYNAVKQKYSTAGFIHRLDRNTDGLMLFSLNETSEAELLKGFKERTFKKYYLAEIYGSFEKDDGTFTDYLLKDENKGLVKVFGKEVEGSEKIITSYKTLEKREETTLIEVELITGKTHQIRAHTAFKGHFVIGDGKYGNDEINRTLGVKSQRLTAYRIELYFEKSSPLYYLNGKEFKLSCNENWQKY